MASVAGQNLREIVAIPKESKRMDPAVRLPMDVMARVFVLVKEDSVGDQWVVVSKVSQLWREHAFYASELWTTLSFGRKHLPVDVDHLLARSRGRSGLDLSFDTTWTSRNHAEAMLALLHEPSAANASRLQKLNIRTTRQGFREVDSLMKSLDAPNLATLALDDRTKRIPCNQPGDALFRTLPNLPSLTSLRVRGLLLDVRPELFQSLTTLEMYNLKKYEQRRLPSERVKTYLCDVLALTTRLQRLKLHFPMNDQIIRDPNFAVELPALEYLEILDDNHYPAILFSALRIPKTAAVHLHSRVPNDDYNWVLLNALPLADHGMPIESFAKTTALVFNANLHQSVHGWTNSEASGEPAWGLMGELSLRHRAARRKMLWEAFRELPTIVRATQIVHLELHIHWQLPTRGEDWVEVLSAFTKLRVLRVGGERAAWTMLDALPKIETNTICCRPGLPLGLQEVTLCLDSLRASTAMFIATKLGWVRDVHIRLPRDHARIGPEFVWIWEQLRLQWKMRVSIDFGATCETCMEKWDRDYTLAHEPPEVIYDDEDVEYEEVYEDGEEVHEGEEEVSEDEEETFVQSEDESAQGAETLQHAWGSHDIPSDSDASSMVEEDEDANVKGSFGDWEELSSDDEEDSDYVPSESSDSESDSDFSDEELEEDDEA